jgi:phytoene dehydrogenase-like protein
LFDWLRRYIIYNTLEISIPALRDPSLSLENETSLIVSTLFDYNLMKHIADLGYYDSFKELINDVFVSHLSDGFIDNLKQDVIDTLIATPLTIVKRTNNSEGSATGWSFANKPFPTEYQFLRVSKAVLTPIDSIKQAGQWTFNPAGVPVAALTGKLAADAVSKDLKKLKYGKGLSNE